MREIIPVFYHVRLQDSFVFFIHHALVLKSTHQRADHPDFTKVSLKGEYAVKMVLFLFEIQLKTVNQDTGDS